MNVLEAKKQAQAQLAAASIAEAAREATLICAYLLGVEPGQLALHLDAPIEEIRLEAVLKQRLQGQPLQYVLGQAGFMGLDFAVGPGVLIPRPDTEILVEQAMELLKEHPSPQIADICTGSGAIAVSLAYHLPQAEVYAVDVSATALDYAATNAKANNVAGRCHFFAGDLLVPLTREGLRFDLIISNPPYVSGEEMAQLPPDILGHEPELALYGGEDGLDFYRRLAITAAPLLKPGGYMLLEHGWQQQEQITALLEAAGWQILKKVSDYGGRERAILARST